jgi:Ferredoxin-like domain in Api92-like protein
MPNWVTNILTFEGEQNQIDQLLQKIKGEPFEDGSENPISFNSIIPMPAELEGTVSPMKIISQKEYDAQEKRIANGQLTDMENSFRISRGLTKELSDKYKKEFGADNWYDWHCKNWGTKWNACHATIEENKITFDTAWATPYPVIEKISEMFPEITITLKYADEDFGHNCGVLIFEGGEVVEEDDGGGYEFANEVLQRVTGESALEEFGYQDEDMLDEGDYVDFVLGVMFEDFVQPSVEDLQELSKSHIEKIFNHVQTLQREDLKDYENILREILDNKMTFFSLEHEIEE